MKLHLDNLIHFIVVAVLFPIASLGHFTWPIDQCVIADSCNHTWYRVCGKNTKSEFRVFLDYCDMIEFNCDHKQKFVTVDYKNCCKVDSGGYVHCPSQPTYRRNNIRLPIKHIAVTNKWIEVNRQFPRKHRTFLMTTRRPTTKTNRKPKMSLRLKKRVIGFRLIPIALRNETVWRKGKMVVKVFKGLEKDKDSVGVSNNGLFFDKDDSSSGYLEK